MKVDIAQSKSNHGSLNLVACAKFDLNHQHLLCSHSIQYFLGFYTEEISWS